MNYRTKLFALVLATAVLSELVLGGLNYFQFKRTLREELASNLRSISLTTAALIGGDENRADPFARRSELAGVCEAS